jgi:quercetin dioxygenase-like cupin family protein
MGGSMMKQGDILMAFENGNIVFPDKEIDAAALPWKPNPAFKGVFGKELVSAADTNGAFSCLLVKIEKGGEVSEHSHDTQWEYNEVLEGRGTFSFGEKKSDCKPGDSYDNPPGVPHSVAAPKEDLYIFAKFAPALK